MKKSVIIILVAVVVVLIVIAALVGGKENGTNVSSELVKKRSITEMVSASGKIEPEVEVSISPEVSGEIIELLVKEGDQVEKDQLLVRINPDIYVAAVTRAEAAALNARANLANMRARLVQSKAQFENARRVWERNKAVHAQGAISESEFDQIKANFEVAQADVTAAEESVRGAEFSVRSAEASSKEANDNLRRTTIYAPQAGTVNGLVVETGERVVGTGMMGGTELMRISDLSAMEVNVEVNESDIVRVSKGDTTLIEVDAYLGKKFKGVVTEIGNTALNSLNGQMSMDQVTNFSVKIAILKSSYQDLMDGDSLRSPFRPGMSATVDIMTEKAYDVVSIPIKAVTTRLDTASSGYAKYLKKSEDDSDELSEPIVCVFVLEDGKARIRAIETGIQDNKYIAVKSGVDEGEEVITGPYDVISRSLSNGDLVIVKEKQEKEEN